jgi:nicotinate-nucleotide pyrophosphorylase (carboxylating)
MTLLITKAQAQAFFKEDAPTGDITTAAIFGNQAQKVKAVIIAKQDITLSGSETVAQILRHCFPQVRYERVKKDSARIKNQQIIARLSGCVQDLLLLERVCLNVFQHLSGIATLTTRFVALAQGKTQILDTRKTLPGLRQLEKQAVLDGGGQNHRQSLSDMYLIKDNHIAAAGSVTQALQNALVHRKKTRGRALIEVEVTSLAELNEALPLNPDIVLLDNMKPALIRRAVNLRNAFLRKTGSAPALEVSGGVTLKTIAGLAKLGVERISIGALTHSAPAVDISMEILTRLTRSK